MSEYCLTRTNNISKKKCIIIIIIIINIILSKPRTTPTTILYISSKTPQDTHTHKQTTTEADENLGHVIEQSKGWKV